MTIWRESSTKRAAQESARGLLAGNRQRALVYSTTALQRHELASDQEILIESLPISVAHLNTCVLPYILAPVIALACWLGSSAELNRCQRAMQSDPAPCVLSTTREPPHVAFAVAQGNLKHEVRRPTGNSSISYLYCSALVGICASELCC